MRQITDAILERRFARDAPLTALDAGCGTGFNVVHLSTRTLNPVFGLDISADAVRFTAKRGLRRLCQASVTDIPFQSETFDLVTSFEVICQGQPPPVEAGLREMRRVLRPGGFLFVRVPAYRWMRSSHDVDVDTTRRFTRPEFQGIVSQAGLHVEWISYANCFLFPAVLARRALKRVGLGEGSDVRAFPPALAWLNSVFRGTLGVEAELFRHNIPLPFGLSIVCLAQKH